jgi:anti-anti-sigma regulatory factor
MNTKGGDGMTDVTFHQKGGLGLLVLSGELTAHDTAKLQQGFLVSFESVDYLVVDLRNVSALDTSCFGLFCTAHRIFTRCSKRFIIVGLRRQLCRPDNAGDRPERPCQRASQCGTGCLWNE